MQQFFQKTPAANDYGDAGSGYGGGYDDEDDSEYDDEVEGSGFRSGHTPTPIQDVLLVVKYLDDFPWRDQINDPSFVPLSISLVSVLDP